MNDSTEDRCYGGRGEKERYNEATSRVRDVQTKYKCSTSDAYRFINLRDENHGAYQAAVIAGLADPDL